MVDEYAYHALRLYGRNWVAYDVIAELVLSGCGVHQVSKQIAQMGENQDG